MSVSDSDRLVITFGSYRITKVDFVQAAKIHQRPSRAFLIIYAMGGFSLLVLVLVGPLETRVIAGLSLLGGVLGETLTRHAITPARQRRSYQRKETLHDELNIEVSDRDIRIFSVKFDFKLTADSVVGWKESKDYILIYVTGRLYVPIPKRLAESSFSLEVLRQRLRQYAGTARV